jgi:hypothetical protein
MGPVDEGARTKPGAREASARGAGAARSAWRDFWPYIVLPPLIVAAGVAWLWFGAEGGIVEAGRYTLS